MSHRLGYYRFLVENTTLPRDLINEIISYTVDEETAYTKLLRELMISIIHCEILENYLI